MKRMILAAGMIVITSGAAMALPPIDGTGTVGTCVETGKIKLKPALVNGGTEPGTTKVKAKGTCSGGTLDGANVVSTKAKGSGTTTTNDCVNLIGTSASNLTLTIKWKVAPGTQKLNPSIATFTSQTGGATGDGHGSFDITGSITSGSFTGNPVTAHVETDQLVADLGAACAAKGIKKITFGLNGMSTSTD